MTDAKPPRRSWITRRELLAVSPGAVGVLLDVRLRRAWAASPALSFEQLHTPALRLPPFTSNGAKVPVIVEMSHPMDADHFITRLEVVNARDPVPSKGVFRFSPMNGAAYLAFQARVDEGTSEMMVTAECSQHGRWSAARSITVADGGGGCAGAAPPSSAADDIRPPVIRIPEEVRRGPIRRDEIIDVQVKIKHPSRTGLAGGRGQFVRASEPFHLTSLDVFYRDERVSGYRMTSAISDNPFITFRLRAVAGGLLRVHCTNTRGDTFEAKVDVRVS